MNSSTMTNLLIVSVTFIVSWTSLYVCACPASPNCHCMASILFCVGANFTELPSNIPNNIKHMDLHSGALRTIEANKLGHLVDLEELTMDNNKIIDVENGTFDNLTELIKLSLNENKIQYLTPEIFSNLRNLKYLLLSGNSLRTLDGVFVGLFELESLNLDNNQISYIPSFMFEHLPKLYDLQMNNNQITKIHPYSFIQLPSLTVLALGSNPISNLDHVFEKNTNLHYINLTACNFTKFPALAPSLGYLKLGKNRISRINREDTSMYTNLVKLVIDENHLNHIDDNSFLQMPNLTDVYLFVNNLTKFPAFPKSIKRIFLDSNNISSIPAGSFQPNTEIRLLSLRANNIMTFDTSVFQSTTINTLKLDGNPLRILHDNIFLKMPELEHLSLNELHINEIFPNCFLGLDTLKTLDMSTVHIQSDSNILGNFLVHVPTLETLNIKGSPILANYFLSHVSVMESVVNLTSLNLEDNNLSTIPPTVPWHLPYLSDIYLAGNPFHCTEDNFWLQEWYMMEPRIFRNIDKVFCHFPLNLKGRLLKDVTLLDFQLFKDESMDGNEVTTDIITTEVYHYDDYDDLYGPNYENNYLDNMDEEYYDDLYGNYNDKYDNYDFLTYSTIVVTKHTNESTKDQQVVTETPTIVSEKTPDQNHHRTKTGHISVILAVVMAFSVIVFMLLITAMIYCWCLRRSRNVVHHNARQNNGTNDYVFIVSKTDIQNDTADAVPPPRKLTREERGSTTSHASQDITNDTSLKVYTIEVDE